MAYDAYADPVDVTSSRTTWEQPPFAAAPVPANPVVTGDVIVPGEKPRVSTAMQWLLFLRRWGIPVAIILAIFADWWFMIFVVIILAVLPKIIADIPRKGVNAADPQAALRANRVQLRVARQQYRMSARQVRYQQRTMRRG